jgi:dihydrofolate synthase/folylpolyglutamate synthase
MQVTSNLPLPDAGSTASMRFDRLEDWLAWQEGLHFTSIELGLERCMKVAGRMGLLHPDYAVISVAGTNGKGSSVNMLRNILTHAGYATGSYTSPHLVRYNERICLNGVEVSDEMLCSAFDQVDRVRGDISLTYFEFGTLAALDIFQRAGIDIAVLEVGLGGRLDAVNCLDADAALITTIELDHEHWLGRDRETIAREKAGIMRGGSAAVCSDPEPPQSLFDHAAALGTKLQVPGRDFHHHITNHSWEWQAGDTVLCNLPRPSLYNTRQMDNAAGVLMVLHSLSDRFPVDATAIRRGLQEFTLSGRFQMVPDRAQLILDVAHNRQSMELLVQNLRGLPVSGRTHVLIGMLKDKNHAAIFREIMEVADFWHLVTLEGPRGTDSGMLGRELAALGITDRVAHYPAVADALNRIREMVGPQDRIVITGSFLTVGAAMRHLRLPR